MKSQVRDVYIIMCSKKVNIRKIYKKENIYSVKFYYPTFDVNLVFEITQQKKTFKTTSYLDVRDEYSY